MFLVMMRCSANELGRTTCDRYPETARFVCTRSRRDDEKFRRRERLHRGASLRLPITLDARGPAQMHSLLSSDEYPHCGMECTRSGNRCGNTNQILMLGPTLDISLTLKANGKLASVISSVPLLNCEICYTIVLGITVLDFQPMVLDFAPHT